MIKMQRVSEKLYEKVWYNYSLSNAFQFLNTVIFCKPNFHTVRYELRYRLQDTQRVKNSYMHTTHPSQIIIFKVTILEKYYVTTQCVEFINWTYTNVIKCNLNKFLLEFKKLTMYLGSVAFLMSTMKVAWCEQSATATVKQLDRVVDRVVLSSVSTEFPLTAHNPEIFGYWMYVLLRYRLNSCI